MDKNFHFGYPIEEVIEDLNRETSLVTGYVNQKEIKNLVKKMKPRKIKKTTRNCCCIRETD